MTMANQQDQFRELYENCGHTMYRVAYGVLRDQGFAEDAVQQTFLKLYREMDRLGDVNSPQTRAFAVVAVKNTAIDLYRKRRRECFISLEDLAYTPVHTASSPEQTVIDGQSEEMVERLLGELGEKYAVILVLRFCRGYRNKEIAQHLGLSEAAVASRIFQAKRLLAKQLQAA